MLMRGSGHLRSMDNVDPEDKKWAERQGRLPTGNRPLNADPRPVFVPVLLTMLLVVAILVVFWLVFVIS
jgi:hypothetical protein